MLFDENSVLLVWVELSFHCISVSFKVSVVLFCVYSITAVVSDKRQSYFVISIPMNLLIENVTSPKSKEYDKFPEYCQN